jgi:phage terminase large subunit-like protein
MIERKAYVAREMFPTRGDKAIRAQSIRGRIAMNGLYVPTDAPWVPDLISEMMSFPVGVHDDQVDALGLIGQILDRMQAGRALEQASKEPQPLPGQIRLPPPPTHGSGTRIKI